MQKALKNSNIADGALSETKPVSVPIHQVALDRWIFFAILSCLAIQFYCLFNLEVNWDEFLYLSRVYDYQSQMLNRALQTFHVYFFNWLPLVDANEVRQVEAGRIVMFFLEAGTATSVYLVAQRFVSRTAAMVAVLAYVSAGFTMIHGASFRADPLAAFFMMASIALLSRRRLRHFHFALAAGAIALGAMVTVKVGFYAPALVAIGLWQVFRFDRPLQMLVRMVATGIGALIMFISLYIWHEASLPSADIDGSQRMMTSAAQKTLLSVNFFPTWRDFLIGALTAPISAFLLLAGLYRAISAVLKQQVGSAVSLALLGLAAPLLSFLFYRNAFPYYFAFIFPPAMILAGYAVDQLKLNQRHILLATAMMTLFAILTVWSVSDRNQEVQSELIETVHKIFPQPVPVIDRNSMIASFPKRGIFMSSWGLQEYRQKSIPVFEEILREEVVPLLILNSPTLEHAVGDPISGRLRGELFGADQDMLRSNYIAHWGKIWVAGKKLSVNSRSKKFTIVIPGAYKLEASSSVTIDGKLIAPEQVFTLGRGDHFSVSKNDQDIILRWSQAAYRPDFEPSKEPIYRGF